MRENHQDIQRVIQNQHRLLEILPEIVVLARADGRVEYMNPSARRYFATLLGDQSSSPDHDRLAQLFSMAYHAGGKARRQIHFAGSPLEYIAAPFTGYRGEQLSWLFFHDRSHHAPDTTDLEFLGEQLTRNSHPVQPRTVNQEDHGPDLLPPQKERSGQMVGSSRALQELREMITRVAKSDATILITGESGTGKELVANMLRESSNRQQKPYLKINCNAINDSLLESDLFGYEKGAFTGADTRRKGKFEVVDRGTLFLDEIGDISPRMQAALLRVLQDGEIIRVGGNRPIKVNVRIIAATNTNLAKAVHEGSFRLDLFYRLNIITIFIPPLRQRKDDIPDLAAHFIRKYRKLHDKEVNFLPRSLIRKLQYHDWPGNVRELENIIQRAVLISKSNIISEQDLIFDATPEPAPGVLGSSYLQNYQGQGLKRILAAVEREILEQTLIQFGGNVAASAEELQIGKTSLYDKLKRYQLTPRDIKLPRWQP